MTLLNFVIVIILDILIIVLAIKTKIYTNILKTVKKTVKYITMLFIIFFPFCLFALLIVIYNAICSTTPTETSNIDIINEYNRLKDLKQFGIDCIRYSPMFYLVMCFLIQSVLHYKNEEIANNNTNWLKTVLLKFKVSIIINDVTILIFMVFFFINLSFDVFKMDVIKFILNYSFDNIYSENSFRMILLISTGILFYLCIFFISATFIDGIINYKNETTENTRIRKIKYLVYLPFINICLIAILRNHYQSLFGRQGRK